MWRNIHVPQRQASAGIAEMRLAREGETHLQMEPGNGFEPPTCSLRMSRTTSCANLAWLRTANIIHIRAAFCKGVNLMLYFWRTDGQDMVEYTPCRNC